MNKVFLDTNIILDILSPSRPNHCYSERLLKKLANCEVYISEDMISTIYYVVKEKHKVLSFFELVLQEWHVVPFGENVIKKSLLFAKQQGVDLEDTMQCLCAKEYGCEVLLTNDKKFIDCGVELQNYDQFLGYISR